MTIVPCIDGEEITIHDKELASKLLAEWQKEHTAEFLQAYALNELRIALRKEHP